MKFIEIKYDELPQKLIKIKNPPQKLWAVGNLELLNDNSIAVVGSRDCTEYGKKWCRKFVKDLLEYNLTIISGMAVGIDSIAHKTVLEYGGKTIAVLPSGLESIYPKENEQLFKEILENDGLIISEYPLEFKANSNSFLERNRIVSGLSIGTLVIEAEYRSGTSVTARITKQEGKEVFCVPGSLDNRKSIGTNMMIRRGAKLVTDVKDIVSNYDFLRKERKLEDRPLEKNRLVLSNIQEEYREICKLLLKKPMEINEIAKIINIPINEIMSKITMLEINGIIYKNLKGEFEIKEE